MDYTTQIHCKRGENPLCRVYKRFSQSLILLLILQTLLEMIWAPPNLVFQKDHTPHFSWRNLFLYKDSGSQIWLHFGITWKFYKYWSHPQRYWFIWYGVWPEHYDFLKKLQKLGQDRDFHRRGSGHGPPDTNWQWGPGRRQSQRTWI